MENAKFKIVNDKYCRQCDAICCRNLAVEIGAPENKEEVEDLMWQLHFDTVKVYIHNRRWYQLVEGKCMYLSKDNMCTIYERRPDRCREHKPKNCEFFGDFYNVMLETPEDLQEYLSCKKKKKSKSGKRRA